MDQRVVILVPSERDMRADQREYWNNFVFRVRYAIEKEQLHAIVVPIDPADHHAVLPRP